MKNFAVPHADLEVSSVVLGLMRIAKLEDTAIRALFDAAIESGITFFDHADVYGGAPHRSETRFAEALGLSAADRARIVIQSKAGIRNGYFDFSKDHILSAVDGPISLGDFGEPHQDGACNHEGQCVLLAIWKTAGEHMRLLLDGFTLQSVADAARGTSPWPDTLVAPPLVDQRL